MMKAPVNNIIPFSNVDGPGNRCAIFFQSCPFTCLYCHNPETIHMCNNCGTCVASCPAQALELVEGSVDWKKERCVNCDTCINVCPHLSSPKITWMEVDDIIEIVKKRKAFIRGITVSGGECMNHAPFLLELFKRVKELGLTCLIDSNGYYDFRDYQELLSLSDGVMLDVKAIDPIFHKEITGCDNHQVLKNLQYLIDVHKLYEVRTVILPECDEQNIETIAYVSKLIAKDTRYKLIKYRPFGVREEGIRAFGTRIDSDDKLFHYREICDENDHTNVIVL